jgi:hypothetical protein
MYLLVFKYTYFKFAFYCNFDLCMNGIVRGKATTDQFDQHKSSTLIHLAHTALCKTKSTMI